MGQALQRGAAAADDQAKDYRLKIKVVNNNLLARMEAIGFANAAALARHARVSPGQIGELLNMKVAPRDTRGHWRSWVQRVADALYCAPEDLFNAQQENNPLACNVSEVELSQDQIEAAMGADDPIARIDEQMSVRAMLADANLTDRELRVLKMRNGIDGPEMTLKEIGKVYDVQSERIRQIEGKALRKLQHPKSIARELQPPESPRRRGPPPLAYEVRRAEINAAAGWDIPAWSYIRSKANRGNRDG